MSLADITYEIDDYDVQIFGRDWGGSEHQWARARIEFADGSGESIGGVVFLQEGSDAGADEGASVSDYDSTTLYGDDQIWLTARVDQFDRILDVLRHEPSVFVHWKWRTEPEDGDGYGWISTRGGSSDTAEEKSSGFFPYITRT